jgi:predicted nucleic acid-binding protein
MVAPDAKRATLRIGAPRNEEPLIHLDTSFLIRSLVADTLQDRKLREWLADGQPVGMSCIAWAEFLCGPVQTRHLKLALEIVAEPERFGLPDAELAARLFNQSGRRRGTLTDCMIAASALRVGGSLATANAGDFHRFVSSGLSVLTA